MYNVNQHIKRILLNEYRGSEKKDTVILDDDYKYLVKKPDPTREKNRKEIISYINNVYSEYIGCNIAKIIGLNVQETRLGEYTTKNRYGEEVTKIVCLCKDVRNKNEKMRELDTIELSFDLENEYITFEKVEEIINQIKERLNLTDNQELEIKNFYYELFIFDALIGNTDRHNGNIAIILNENDEFSRISPIYDCGSCLLPLVDETEISNCNLQVLGLSIDSVIKTADNRPIRYNDYLLNIRNNEVDKALTKIICNIDLVKIYEMIKNTDYISEGRKQFYIDIIDMRYNKILLPALEQVFNKENNKNTINKTDIDLYKIYLENIKQINSLKEFEKTQINCDNLTYDVMKVSKKFALCIKDNICVGLIPIRSNNDEIRKAIGCFKNLGIDITNKKIKIKNNDKMDKKKKRGYYER